MFHKTYVKIQDASEDETFEESNNEVDDVVEPLFTGEDETYCPVCSILIHDDCLRMDGCKSCGFES